MILALLRKTNIKAAAAIMKTTFKKILTSKSQMSYNQLFLFVALSKTRIDTIDILINEMILRSSLLQ
jgi:hypothetical protein